LVSLHCEFKITLNNHGGGVRPTHCPGQLW
jgi:hypothetical protein